MDKHKIKAIIFDLGNVLINFDHTIASRRVSKFTDKAPQEIFNLFFDSGVIGLFEAGKVSPEEFFLKIKDILSLKLDYAEFLPIWNEIFFLTPDNRQVYNLAKSLKGRYKVALLSNINVLHFDYLKSNFSVFDAFDNIFTSYEAGLRKPDRLIYNNTLRALGVLPEEAFYVDDRSDLIEEARSLGIKAFVYKGTEQLKKDFLSAGVCITPLNTRDSPVSPSEKRKL